VSQALALASEMPDRYQALVLSTLSPDLSASGRRSSSNVAPD
jgi:hypothetical protein